MPVASIEGYGTVMGATGGQGTIVLGTNDVDVELSGINGLPEFKDLTVRKVGTGVLTLSLGGFSVPLRIESGVARVPYFQPAVYSHYRFVIDEGVSASRNGIQFSEFRLLASVEDGFADVTARRSGFTYGEGANDREGNNQGVGKLFDGDTNTKWLTMETGAGSASAAAKANCWFQIDFDAPQEVAFYDWQTADDCYDVNSSDCRLPWKWRLLGSDDGESWTLVDERTLDKSRQYAICEWTGPYGAGDARVLSQSMGPNFDFSAPVTIAGGVFDVNHPVRCVGLTQTGGKVKIGEHGSISLLGALWTGADFTDDSSGAIEVVGGMTSTIYAGSSLAFKGNVVVRDGTLLVGAGARHRATSDRLFRFTIKKTYSDAACTQLSGLRILDGDGNILSGGLVAADPGTDPTQLAAGSCCYAEDYSQGGSSKVENLFDGDTGTKMCLTSLNTWRTVYFRLPADKTALAVAYQLTTANDNTPARNPSIWTLESSADGIHWSVVDERKPGEFENPTTTFTDFNAGTPLDLRQAVYLPKIDNGVTFPAGSGFSVQDGALLKVADGQAVDGLFGEGRVGGSVTVRTFEAAGDSSGLKVAGTLTIAANPEFRIVGFPAEFEETGLANGVTVTVAEANGIAGAENLAQATFPGLSSVKHGAAKAFVEDGKLKVTVYGVKPGFAILLK